MSLQKGFILVSWTTKICLNTVKSYHKTPRTTSIFHPSIPSLSTRPLLHHSNLMGHANPLLRFFSTVRNTKNNPSGPILNANIRQRRVRLIDDVGVHVGVLETPQALRKAQEKKMDLILIDSNVEPVVCKIGDYNKIEYANKKKLKNIKSKIKRISLKIDTQEHDMLIKLKNIREFVKKGHKVNIGIEWARYKGDLSPVATKKLEHILNLLEPDAAPMSPIKIENFKVTVQVNRSSS